MTSGGSFMAFARGDVVLVPFPTTDLADARVRPAVIFSVEGFTRATGDVIVAMITGQKHDLDSDYGLRDWRQAGLLVPSWVRAKLATLEEGLVRFSPGRLSARDFDAVASRLRKVLGWPGG